MGMYTEVYICSKLTKDAPMDVINYMFADGNKPDKLPDHEFFSLGGWDFIGKSCSYYHIPFVTNDLRFDDISKSWHLVSRSDLKNYGGEIESFFDWIMPYLDVSEGVFVGYKRYEEFDEPTLYFKDGG